MNCPKCGYENKEDALYCNLCQEVLKKEPVTDGPGINTGIDGSEKPKIGRGYILLIILAVLTAGAYFYSRLDKEDNKISNVLSINDKQFTENVIKSELPVLVDFWAPWCPPCKIMGPIIDELQIEYANRIAVYKINTDENPDLARSHDISGIPAFIFFNKGNETDRIIGAVSKEIIKLKIEQILSKQ